VIRLIIILCLLPGAAITVHAMVTMYGAMAGNGEVDETKLRSGITLGLNWMMIGLAVAAALLLLRAVFRLLRPRRPVE
jgi:hypothetical protein